MEIIPTRGLRGGKDEVQREFSKIIDDRKIVHARASNFMDFEPQPAANTAWEQRWDIYKFLCQPRMLDAWTFKAAPLTFEYAAGDRTATEIARRHSGSEEVANRAITSVHYLAKKPKKSSLLTTCRWEPPLKPAPDNAHLPKPSEWLLFNKERDGRNVSPEDWEGFMFVEEFGRQDPLAGLQNKPHPATARITTVLNRVLDIDEEFGVPRGVQADFEAIHNRYPNSEGNDSAAFNRMVQDLRKTLPEETIQRPINLAAWTEAVGITLAEFEEFAELKLGVVENVTRSAAAEKRVRMFIDAAEVIWGVLRLGAPARSGNCATISRVTGASLCENSAKMPRGSSSKWSAGPRGPTTGRACCLAANMEKNSSRPA